MDESSRLRAAYRAVFGPRVRSAVRPLATRVLDVVDPDRPLLRLSRWARVPSYRQRAVRLGRLRQVDRGRCFVIGNGPSLSTMDLGPLAAETTWMSNRAYVFYDQIRWRPSYYVVTDRHSINRNADDFSRLIEREPGTHWFLPDEVLLGRELQTKAGNVTWVPTTYMDLDHAEPSIPDELPMGLDTVGLAVGYTVTAAAIQLAAFLGYDPIYLIGCDNSYQKPAEDETIEVNTVLGTEVVVAGARDDVNHFHPDYHRPGDEWVLPRTDLVVKTYELVRDACERAGVTVLNATAGGQLEVFPRVDYSSLV